MIHTLPPNSKLFATSVNNVYGSNATNRIQMRAERGAATSTVRDLVREESSLSRAGNRPDELRRVRSRIDASCTDYTGLKALVDELRVRYRCVPAQLPASIPAWLESNCR